jgi:hypothetical protein
MTQQETQERNKQIALMLGWKITDSIISYIPEESSFQHEVGYSANGFLQFHSDWNWLHEAAAVAYSLLSPSDSRKHDIIQLLGRNQKEAVFIAVSDFAKLYIQNNFGN